MEEEDYEHEEHLDAEKSGRKRARNNKLQNFIDAGGAKPKIKFDRNTLRPVGKWSNAWVSELGIIAKEIPLTFNSWKDLEDKDKLPLYKRVLVMFGTFLTD